jgi:hypothetical protein
MVKCKGTEYRVFIDRSQNAKGILWAKDSFGATRVLEVTLAQWETQRVNSSGSVGSAVETLMHKHSIGVRWLMTELDCNALENYRNRADEDDYREEEPTVLVPTSDHFARALHICDPDVLEYACKVGEASKEEGGKKLTERGPKVMAAIEKMWARDELGLRTKWIDMATRALAILRNK